MDVHAGTPSRTGRLYSGEISLAAAENGRQYWWNVTPGPGGVGSPGAFPGDKWGAAVPGIGRPSSGPDGGAGGLVPAPGTPPALGSRTAKHTYRKAEMVSIYKRLVASRALALPQEVDREDPSLFAEAGQPDVLEVLLGIHQPGTGGEPAVAHAPFPPGMLLALPVLTDAMLLLDVGSGHRTVPLPFFCQRALVAHLTFNKVCLHA